MNVAILHYAAPPIVGGADHMKQVLERDAAHRLRRRVLARFTWRRIVRERVIPLLHPND